MLISTVLINVFLWPTVLGRVIALSLALTATWLGNRYFTFNVRQGESKKKNFIRYQMVQVGGLTLNMCVYLLVLALKPEGSYVLQLAIFCGAISALFWNFSLLKYWVYSANTNGH